MEENQNPNEPRADQRTGNQVFNAAQGNVSFQPVDDVPFESVPLPSRGVIYSKDNALFGQEKIDIRVMTAREEDILTSQALIKRGTVITELLKSCILTPGVNVSDMISGDRNAIMVALRITGYGPEYPAEIQCSECDHKFEHEFDLSRLAIKRLSIKPIEEGRNAFEFVLPSTVERDDNGEVIPESGVKVLFKFLTGSDQEEIDIIQDKMKKLGNMRDTFVTTRLKWSILRIGDVSDKSQISRFVDRMRAGDSKSLRKYMDKNEPGMVMRQGATCPACGNSEEVGMPLGPQFFWPE